MKSKRTTTQVACTNWKKHLLVNSFLDRVQSNQLLNGTLQVSI